MTVGVQVLSCDAINCAFDGLFGLSLPDTTKNAKGEVAQELPPLYQAAVSGILNPPIFTLSIGNLGSNVGAVTIGGVDTEFCGTPSSYMPVPAGLGKS